MRYQLRSSDFPKIFKLVDLHGNNRVAYRGPWPWACAYSQLLNFEDARVRGEIGGSVPWVWKPWPKDGRFPDRPMGSKFVAL